MSLRHPTMNPQLETAAGVWPGFHNAFLTYAQEIVQPLLPPAYYAQLQTREAVGIAGSTGRVIYSDAVIRRADEAREGDGRRAQPEHLVITADELVTVAFLEIRSMDDRRVVTLVELLSPGNKRPGPDREAFERKQAEALATDVGWVEIDLLRGGRRLGCHPSVDAHCRRKEYDYVVVVSRGAKRRPSLDLELYGFMVDDPLPVVAVPLCVPDPDVALDLGRVFARTFESGAYTRILADSVPGEPIGD